MEREELIAELREAGIKHNPDAILRIAKLPEGKIVFLEIGDDRSGWQHIWKEHTEDFAARGIPEDQIIDAVMAAAINGRILGNQGRSRSVYEIEFNGTIQYISVELASNGYIVGANPTRRNLIRRFTQER